MDEDQRRDRRAVNPQAALESEDYYFEGANLVFTEAYHLKRGYCCGSGCRHCPYGHAAVSQRPDGAAEEDAG